MEVSENEVTHEIKICVHTSPCIPSGVDMSPSTSVSALLAATKVTYLLKAETVTDTNRDAT
jgi:hypothetical protein